MASERPPPRVYRVAEIDREVRFLLEEVYADVWVEGEVSNLKASSSGHFYFSLNDWKESASLSCILFAKDAQRSRVKLSEGLRVRCRGKLTVHEPQGRFQLSVRQVEVGGLGELLAQIEALKEKLTKEGLFDGARKRPLPLLPRCIGVVTSREGAAIRDVIQVVQRRFPTRLLVAHASVQGVTAPTEILWALKVLERRSDVEVILVTRGGGSVEDLMAFSDERVVRAIVACKVPVVSAIGHETDSTLSDLAADYRAPTPSAAAERLVPERATLAQELTVRARRLARAMDERLRAARRDLESLEGSVADPTAAIATYRQTLDGLVQRAERVLRRRASEARARTGPLHVRLERVHPRTRLTADRSRLENRTQRLVRALADRAKAARTRERQLASALAALSPLAVLGRGYSITLHGPSGLALRDPATAATGDPLEIVLAQGRLRARVD